MRVPRPSRVALIAALTATAVGGLIVLSNDVEPSAVSRARVIATSLCSLGAMGVVWMGLRGRLAEVGVTGVVLLLVPLFDLVAALGSVGSPPTPQSAAFADAVAVPLAALAAVPLLLPDTWLRTALARRWRLWTGAWVGAGLSLAALLARTAIRPPLPPELVLIAGALAGSVVFVCIGRRHLLLFQVGRQWISLLIGVTFLAVATIGAVGHGVGVPSHLALAAVTTDVVLSFTAIIGMAVVARRLRHIPDVLAPIATRDPLAVLALGLDPVVEEFVARVGRKDARTRDHIVRVGELAMRVAIRAGIRGRKLRALGIGALLHDVGKLVVPDEVLRKPGSLTSEEYELVKRHASAGDELLAGSPALAGAAKYVRWHHERPDGTGYPDGLTGDDIPLDVAIVSVCDAFDAMTQDRHYRRAMTTDRALAILDEHSGTQFDPAAVDLLRAELAASPQISTVFANVGDTATEDAHLACDHALPVGYIGEHAH